MGEEKRALIQSPFSILSGQPFCSISAITFRTVLSSNVDFWSINLAIRARAHPIDLARDAFGVLEDALHGVVVKQGLHIVTGHLQMVTDVPPDLFT
jgi:hypothetical protein